MPAGYKSASENACNVICVLHAHVQFIAGTFGASTVGLGLAHVAQYKSIKLQRVLAALGSIA